MGGWSRWPSEVPSNLQYPGPNPYCLLFHQTPTNSLTSFSCSRCLSRYQIWLRQMYEVVSCFPGDVRACSGSVTTSVSRFINWDRKSVLPLVKCSHSQCFFPREVQKWLCAPPRWGRPDRAVGSRRAAAGGSRAGMRSSEPPSVEMWNKSRTGRKAFFYNHSQNSDKWMRRP